MGVSLISAADLDKCVEDPKQPQSSSISTSDIIVTPACIRLHNSRKRNQRPWLGVPRNSFNKRNSITRLSTRSQTQKTGDKADQWQEGRELAQESDGLVRTKMEHPDLSFPVSPFWQEVRSTIPSQSQPTAAQPAPTTTRKLASRRTRSRVSLVGNRGRKLQDPAQEQAQQPHQHESQQQQQQQAQQQPQQRKRKAAAGVCPFSDSETEGNEERDIEEEEEEEEEEAEKQKGEEERKGKKARTENEKEKEKEERKDKGKEKEKEKEKEEKDLGMHSTTSTIEEYKLRRTEREQERNRARAILEEREREWERERAREREANRKILLERERNREMEKERLKREEAKARGLWKENLQKDVGCEKMRDVGESNQMMDEDDDDDEGFYLATSEERDDVLPSLHKAIASVEGLLHVSPVAGYLASMTRDLLRLHSYCLFTMAHPERPLSWRMGYFGAIPTEIQAHILSFTEIADLWKVRSVCKIWNAIIARECYWVTLVDRQFSPVRNKLYASHFSKNALWLYRTKAKKLCVKDHIVGEWTGRYWNKTTLALWEGEWKDGRILGYGSKFIPSTGDYFEGNWKDEKLSGYGRADTKVYHYQGYFRENMRHGKGVCTWKQSGVGKDHPDDKPYYVHYDGDWQYDMMDGFGTMKFSNGDVYSGEWLEGLRDGLGTFADVATGKNFRGIWEKDTCQITFDEQGDVIPTPIILMSQ